ncbi:hypothetical protein [Streptomyces niveus]|uniref:hypothetical protein n=1 Tax=Streptomyces niveus TaxID=193462 RepID=UPI0035DB1552
MKRVPSNVVRCVECDGPIKHGTSGPHVCANCKRGVYAADKTYAVPGEHWKESYGYLVAVETEDDPRDTEEEIEDLYFAIGELASIFGDKYTASGLGGHFTCPEADRVARTLMVGGYKRAAMTFLEGHGMGDDDEDDEHGSVEDFEAYVLELAGQPVPELVEEPEPQPKVSLVKAAKLPTVTVEELIDLMGL